MAQGTCLPTHPLYTTHPHHPRVYSCPILLSNCAVGVFTYVSRVWPWHWPYPVCRWAVRVKQAARPASPLIGRGGGGLIRQAHPHPHPPLTQLLQQARIHPPTHPPTHHTPDTMDEGEGGNTQLESSSASLLTAAVPAPAPLYHHALQQKAPFPSPPLPPSNLSNKGEASLPPASKTGGGGGVTGDHIVRRVCLALQAIGAAGQEGRGGGGGGGSTKTADEVALIKLTARLQLEEVQRDLSISTTHPPTSSSSTQHALGKTLGVLNFLLDQLEKLGGGGEQPTHPPTHPPDDPFETASTASLTTTEEEGSSLSHPPTCPYSLHPPPFKPTVSSSSSPPLSSSSLRLLLVVKEAKTALLLTHQASPLFRVEVVRSSLQALSRLSVQHYDVVLMEAGTSHPPTHPPTHPHHPAPHSNRLGLLHPPTHPTIYTSILRKNNPPTHPPTHLSPGFPMVDGLEAVRRLRRFEGWLDNLQRPDILLSSSSSSSSSSSPPNCVKPPSFVVLVRNGWEEEEEEEEEGSKYSFYRRALRAGADLVVKRFSDVR